MIGRDGIVGLAVAAGSLALFSLTLGLERNPLVPIGPGFYPRLVLGVTALLALGLAAADVLSKAKRPARVEGLNYGTVLSMFAVFGLFCGALPLLGFRISTLLYLAATNVLLDFPRNKAGWLRVTAVSVITTAVVYYLFERYLTVLLPRGRWTDF